MRLCGGIHEPGRAAHSCRTSVTRSERRLAVWYDLAQCRWRYLQVISSGFRADQLRLRSGGQCDVNRRCRVYGEDEVGTLLRAEARCAELERIAARVNI